MSTVQSTRSIERLSLKGDEEARVMKHRIRSCSDFIAAETCFYNICLSLFNLKVKTTSMAPGIKGRLSKDSDGFETLCVWIETEWELQLQLITESKDHEKILLRNTHNKTELIRILRQRFTETGIENEQSVGDAHFFTVKKALNQTIVVSNGIDILVLLMYHCCCSTMKDIVFATTKSVNKKVNVEYSARDIRNKQPLTRICCSPMPGQDAPQQSKTKGKLTLFNNSNRFKFKRVCPTLGMCSRHLILWENLD